MARQAGFKNLAELRHIGGSNFQLLKDLVFYSAEQQREYITPAGTITDLASIPWWAQSFCQVLGNNIRSAIQHDFHTTDKGKKANGVTQKIADDLFAEGLAVDDVRASKARVMASAVRVFQRVKYKFKRGVSYG